ncbi:hypothetical protein T265_09864 [Opisthorchis viverrini]|uniref:Uncharacterized protein n=1 Tax=Opisthorchis viverrini TaxID=6198 RepID=A0A074ZF97_OPIVI|nr:hypothetical protein T265_09864 [Opisthorchis viverrini]KER21910.1 hypothetical protein T265_09864 [Opisthorchis viverrini]
MIDPPTVYAHRNIPDVATPGEDERGTRVRVVDAEQETEDSELVYLEIRCSLGTVTPHLKMTSTELREFNNKWMDTVLPRYSNTSSENDFYGTARIQ